MKKLNVSRKVVYGTIAVVAIAGFWFTREEPPVQRAQQNRPAATTSVKATDVFTEEDYNASFPRVEGEIRNVFQPGVVRRSGLAGDLAFDYNPHMIPPEFAGGESNWVYTGTASIDGVPVALVENTSSSDGVFLKHGERWKSAVVVRITPEALVLAGPQGSTRTVKLNNGGNGGLSGTVGGNRPLNAGQAVERAMADGMFVSPEVRNPRSFPIFSDEDDDED